jgi:soluble lytic murein transglycosylase
MQKLSFFLLIFIILFETKNINAKQQIHSINKFNQQTNHEVEYGYNFVKKNQIKNAINSSKNPDVKNFFVILDYSKIQNQKESFDQYLIYQAFLKNRFIEYNGKIEPLMKKNIPIQQDSSCETDSTSSPQKLINQYKKNHSLIKQNYFIRNVKQAWRTKKFTNQYDEAIFAKTFASIIDKDDHKIRLEELLWSEDPGSAQRMLSRVDLPSRIEAKKRLDIQTSTSKDELFRRLNRLRQTEKNNQAIIFDAISWCKKRKMQKEMLALIEIAPMQNRLQNNQWWELLRTEIRDLISSNDTKKHQIAYRIASSHNISNKKIEYVEAEFLAGFVAFNYLKNYELALTHFKNSLNHAKQDFRISRAQYWISRTYERFNNMNLKTSNKNDTKNNFKTLSANYYSKCSGHFTTFYGQICLHKLGKDSFFQEKISNISDNELQQIISQKLFKYYYYSLLTRNSNLAKKIAKIAVLHAKSKKEIAVLAGTANQLGMPEVSLYIGNLALYNMSWTILEASYPTPHYKHIRFNRSLNLAIIKRESAFEQNSINCAGSRGKAHGLMQIIPAAGIDIARNLGIEYDHQALLNPQINVLFGNEFLKHLYLKFNKSTILAIAAYNGGAGSVNKWIGRIGNPSRFKNNLDGLATWIEQIPFRETRYYVQSVLANMMIYQAILNPGYNLNNFFNEIT